LVYLVFARKDANLFNDKASKVFCRDEDFRETVAYRRCCQVLPSWRGVKRKSSSLIATDLRQINILREAKSPCTIYALKRCLRGVTYRDVLTGDAGDASSAEFSDANR